MKQQQFIEKISIGQNNDEVDVSVRKSRRAKRVSLKVTIDNRIELVVPSRVSLKKAITFLHQQRVWLENKMSLHQQHQPIPFVSGSSIPISGVDHIITHTGQIRGVTHLDGERRLLVSGFEEHISRRVRSFLIHYAKQQLTALTYYYAEQLDVSIHGISIRDTKTRWGSCSHRGTLSFSWRLILAPYDVMAYVAAHEVAHRLEMNHSNRFWELVATLIPHYKHQRDWLKKQGKLLQLYG